MEQRHGPEMAAVLAVVAVCVAAALGARCGLDAERASPEVCAAVLRKYAEARLRQADPSPSTSQIVAHQERVAQRSERSDRFEQCPREMSASAAACALDAGNADAMERCLQ